MLSLKSLSATGEHEGRLGNDLRALVWQWFVLASTGYSIGRRGFKGLAHQAVCSEALTTMAEPVKIVEMIGPMKLWN